MPYRIPVKTKKQIKFIAYYQIIGGILGVVFAAKGLIELGDLSTLSVVFILFAAIIFALSILCGQRLLKGEIKNGLRLSTINQLAQFFSLSILGFSYRYAAGLYLGFGFDFTDSFLFVFNIDLAQFIVYFKNTATEAVAQINLMALVLLYIIGKTKKDIQTGLELFNSLLPLDQEKDLLTVQTDIFLADKD